MLGLTLSVAQMLLSFAGRARANASTGRRRRGRLAIGAFAAMAVAFAALIHAHFVVSDFSVMNVAANSHTAKPLIYKIAGAWGSHEGSILLWCFALTGYGAAIALARGLPFWLKSLALGVQGALGTLFIGYMVLASNPLIRLAMPPAEEPFARPPAAGSGSRRPPPVPLRRLRRALGGVFPGRRRPDRRPGRRRLGPLGAALDPGRLEPADRGHHPGLVLGLL